MSFHGFVIDPIDRDDPQTVHRFINARSEYHHNTLGTYPITLIDAR